MQAYVEHQLNTSPIVLEIVGKPLKMRIGIHTGGVFLFEFSVGWGKELVAGVLIGSVWMLGPSCGAIMGGPKNFRYDLLGDTSEYY